MSVSESDFKHAQARFPSLVAIRSSNGQIDRVSVDFNGIIGRGNTAKMVYKTILTFDGHPTSPPTIWVTYPDDSQIHHMNIYHSGGALKLPHVCMGNYSSIWSKLPVAERTLLHFLLAAHHVLLTENPASAARR